MYSTNDPWYFYFGKNLAKISAPVEISVLIRNY
jgi:hypothetical protein